MTFATSYVSLVYYTRTLSNTIESVLFVLIMHLVTSYWAVISTGDRPVVKPMECDKSKTKANCEIEAEENNTTKEGSTEEQSTVQDCETKKGKEGQEKQGRKMANSISYGLVSAYSAGVGMVLSFGIFNRPTFPVFAAVPCTLFLLCDLKWCPSMGRWMHLCVFKTFKITAWMTVSSVLIIVCDSFYYGSLSSKDFDHLLENINNIQALATKVTITPWNFIKYNVNSDNLAQHGIHPRFLHFLVNTPLLFGIVAVFPAFSLIQIVGGFCRKELKGSNRVANQTIGVDCFLMLTYLVPLASLSCFPHQEPRFLIPLLCPLALLYGHHLFDIHFKWYISFFWVVFNIFVCGMFFGALHQGGLVPSIYEVRSRILKEPQSNYHILFSHTYMPPRHLLQIPDKNNALFKLDSAEFMYPRVDVHDLKGSPAQQVHAKVREILREQTAFENVRIFLIAPSSLDRHFCTDQHTGSATYEYELLMSFVPQITTEDPPDFMNDVFNCRNPHQSKFCNWTCTGSVFDRLTFALSLNLYSVRLR